MTKNSSLLKKTWRQCFILLISCLLMATAFAQSTHEPVSNELKVTYAFQSPMLETIDIAGTVYDRITLSDCYPAGSAGAPKIPSKGAFLLLPPGFKVSGIDITLGEKISLGTGFSVEPTSQAIPLSQTENLPIPTPDSTIYTTNAAYPGRLYTEVGVYSFRGYQILVLLLHPLQYNPVTGELEYYTTLQVSVTTVHTDIQSEFYRGLTKDRNEIAQKVDNPEMSLRYQQEDRPVPSSREQYDLLIITTNTLKDGFEPLKEAHDATGVSTVIKTLTDIGGSDLESIRNYIRDAYTDWGIEYVLIGGDDTIIPAPILFVSGMDENTTYYEDSMPADLYYACLDGPYNYDGDGNWGEPNDGTGGGDVDLIAEVYVGRACVGSTTEVANFVSKTVAYINKDSQNGFFSKVLFAGEYLGDYGIASYASTYVEQLRDGSSDDGYTTIGIPSNIYTITTLYDTPTYDWPSSAMISVLNNGVHIINHLGHASYDYNMKLDSSDVDTLTNPSNRTCFIYSQGCMAGGFDNGDCIAEHFTIKTTHAAFAGIWNARYGFFWSYSTDGDSQRLHRQFWDAVFGEMKPQIGKANHDSKEDNLPIIGRSCIRWCYYETNLFGDPALQIIQANSPPDKPMTPIGPSAGMTTVNYLFTTSTTDPESDSLYYQWDWDDGTLSEWSGPYVSGGSASASHSWDAAGDYLVRVHARDGSGISVWSDSAAIQITLGPHIEIGELSGRLRLSVELKNTGMVDATNVNWTISVQGFVLLGQESSGKVLIPTGSSSQIHTGFIFGLGPVNITITAADAQKTATAYLLGPFVLNIK